MFVNNLSVYKIVFIIELLTAELLFTFKLERRKHFVWRMVGSWAMSIAVAVLFPIFDYGALYSSFLFLALLGVTIGGLCLCYKEKPFNLIYCAVVAYTVRHLAFQLFSLYMTVIDRSNANVSGMYGDSTVAPEFDFAFFFSLFSFAAIYFIVYVLFFTMFGKKLGAERKLELKNPYMFIVVLLVLFLDIGVNAAVVYNETEANFLNASVFFVNTLILYVYNILCCVFTLYMQLSMIAQDRLKRDIEIIKHLWQQDRQQYKISKENIELINLKCHDLKHQIRQIIEGGVDAKAVKEVENLISIYGSMIETGNETLDVIFTEKSLICQKSNIVLNCMADGKVMSFMDTSDIYILFGNLMDNAIEAVQKLDDVDKRVISINIHSENDIFIANISNYYAGEIALRADGLPDTTKLDRDFHGMGTKSANLIVDKYGGNLEFTADDGIFAANIVIPLTGKS